MKLKGRSSRIWSGLWKQFAVPANVCILLCAMSVWQSFVPYDNTNPEPWRITDNIFSGLWLGLFLSTAACCLPIRRGGIRHIAASLLVVGAVAVNWFWPLSAATMWSLLLCALALCLHFASRENQPVRLNRMAGWFFTCLGISIVIWGALMIVYAAVKALFLPELVYTAYAIDSGITYTILAAVFFLIAPWLFLGGVMDCEGTRYGKFSAFLLLPLYLLLMAVLLAYVGMTVVSWTMPVGQMNPFAIIAGALYVYFHLTLTGEEGSLSAWFRKWGAWLMTPVLIAQAVGVYIRVDAYGLTVSRIMGMGVTALVVAAVISGVLRRRAKWLLIAAACVALVLPNLAVYGAIANQERRLEAALTRNGMIAEDGSIIAGENIPLDDREIIWSAFDYLRGNDEREDSLSGRMVRQILDAREALPEGESHPTYLLQNEIETLLGFEEPGEDQMLRHYHTWQGSASAKKLDTEGFKHAEWLDIGLYYRLDIEGESSFRQDGHDDVTIECYLPALIDTLNAENSSAAPLGTPLKITIYGEETDLTPLLVRQEQNDDGHWLITPEIDRITLPSGKVLHIASIRLYNYQNRNGVRSADVAIKAWLMTPVDTE